MRALTPLRIAPDSLLFTALLGVFAALPALSIDLSAPTLPLIPSALGTSITVASLTLSLFMVGFALGQLGGGRLSDVRGRRPVLWAGLTCYTLAGIGCSLSVSGPMLVIFRLVQGFGAGACSVLSFAMIQDLFEGDAARATRSYVTVIFGIVPMLAPALGAFLSDLAGWRSVHGVLALAGAALLFVTVPGLAETRRFATADVDAGSADLRLLLRNDRRFVGIAFANALSYGAIFAYIAGSPMVIIRQMGLSSTVFAATFAATALALTAGAWCSGKLSRRGVGALTLLDFSLVVAAGAGLALAIASLSGAKSAIVLMPPLLAVMLARGVIAPNLQQLAIERRPDQAGMASAIVGVSQLLSGALASAVVAVLLPNYGVSAIGIPMAFLAAAALVAWRRTGR